METLTVRPSEVQPIVLRAIQVKRPIFIWGAPGIGKSELVEQICHEMLEGLHDILVRHDHNTR